MKGLELIIHPLQNDAYRWRLQAQGVSLSLLAGFDKMHPIVNEDLARETEEKTSAVHFLRFEQGADNGLDSHALIRACQSAVVR